MGGLATVALAFGALAANAVPPGFVDETVRGNLADPINLEFAPDGRVYLSEKAGRLLTWPNLSSFTSGQAATVAADLTTNTHGFWDRGMLGLAIHPAYPQQPYVYVLYAYDAPPGATAPTWGSTCTAPGGATPPPSGQAPCVVTGRLSRLTMNTATGQMVGPETVLIHDWCQEYPSHSVGELAFGEDGALYVSAGDGASFSWADWGQLGQCVSPTNQGGALRSQSPRTNASSPKTLDGTVLRLDPMTGEAMPGNPWISDPDPNMRRVVAYGLRNPFAMTMKPGTNELFIGDVGWNTWEELNYHPNPSSAVRNFGWPCYEGGLQGGSGVSIVQSGYQHLALCQSLYNEGSATPPLYSYRHNQDITGGNDVCPPAVPGQTLTSSSITALAFYTSGTFPGTYNGALFGGDHSRNCVWVMFPDANGHPDPSTIQVFHQASHPVDLAEGPDGNLYYVAHNSHQVRRFRYTGINTPPVATIQASATSGSAPLEVDFDGSGSSDPDGDEIVSYVWDLDGDGQFDDATGANASWTFAPGSHTVRLRVTDHRGDSGTAQVVINASNSAPVPVITSPTFGATWSVGNTISFSGQATDAEEGTLPASALSWQIILHHCELDGSCHGHNIENHPGVAGGGFTAPDHEYPSWIEIRLTATDQYNASTTVSRELQPNTVDLTFLTDPEGLNLIISNTSTEAPHTATFIVGATVEMTAPATQPSGAPWEWNFQSWSNGGERHQVFAAPSQPTTYTANYVSGNQMPVAHIAAEPTSGSAPLNVHLDGSGSTDPEEETLTYSWDLNDDGVFGDATTAELEHSFLPGAHTVSLRVTDPWDLSDTQSIEITAVYTGPVASISSPDGGVTWAIGEAIAYSGSAVDLFEGAIPAGSLSWKATLYPCAAGATCTGTTIHSATGANGTFTPPDAEYPSHIVLSLTASTFEGLTGSTSVTLTPRTTDLTFTTSPAGRRLFVDGELWTVAHVRKVIVGKAIPVTAPSPQPTTTFSSVWVFTGWSQGGAATQTLVAPGSNTTYTANFAQEPRVGLGDSFGLVNPNTGKWHLYDAATGETTSFYYGIPGDLPIMGDWDCDGVSTPGMYRRSQGYIYLRNSNTQGVGEINYFFGLRDDIPIVGDWDGDGCETVSIYRPSEQRFYITNRLGDDDEGFVADYSFVFGDPGDKPFAADFNGDGITDIGLHRESTGLVYLRFSLTSGFADLTFFFGDPGDRIIAGDWSERGFPAGATVGLFRPSNRTLYLRFDNSQGLADFALQYGASQMLPVAGHFGDLPGGAPPPS